MYTQEHPIFYQEEEDGNITEVPIDFEMERMIKGGVEGLAKQVYRDGLITADLYQKYVNNKFDK
jgi:hypothetical protein